MKTGYSHIVVGLLMLVACVADGALELAPTPAYELRGSNSVVYQDVVFKMDETGAAVKSTAYEDIFCEGSSKPRRFIFDKPFLLTLWVAGAPQPYLTLWVAGPDVLVPGNAEAPK
ncbi:MAG: hypothetical protein NTV22_19860 [bacterium]|nr:hypothetical protein [bacterium]